MKNTLSKKTVNQEIDLSSIFKGLEKKQAFTMLKDGIAKFQSAEVKVSKSGNYTVLFTYKSATGDIATDYFRCGQFKDFLKSQERFQYLFDNEAYEKYKEIVEITPEAYLDENGQQMFISSSIDPNSASTEEEKEALYEKRNAEISEQIRDIEDNGYDTYKLKDGRFIVIEKIETESICNDLAELANETLKDKKFLLKIDTKKEFPNIIRYTPSKI